MAPDAPFDELLRAAVGGHDGAHRELWRRYSGGVAAFARSQGAEDPDAVCSDAFLAAFRALPGFDGDEAGFRALLFTIARRRVVDDRRRRARRVRELPWNREDDSRQTPGPEQEVVDHENRRDARALLDTLPPDQREVLMLRLFGELSVAQVAEAVGKSEGAVKALQRRGLERLRRTMHRGRASGSGSIQATGELL